jgi:hypothetical protein
VAGHNSFSGQVLLIPDKHSHFAEGARVEEPAQPLTGGKLALRVLPVYPLLPDGPSA